MHTNIFRFLSLITQCPVPSEITDIPNIACPEDIGQIVRIGLQRKYSSGSTRNAFTISSADPDTLANWTSLLNATDATKVQFSPHNPLLGNPEGPVGDFRTAGGGNETAQGIEKLKGRTAATFNCQLQSVDQRVAKAFKYYEIEELQVYFINESGYIIGEVDDKDTPTKFRGIPCRTFMCGDLQPGGYDGISFNPIRIIFPPNWSDSLYVVVPDDFDALSASLSGS